MENLIFKSPETSANSICFDFQDISIKTWNLLGNAHNSNFNIGEETITDINLLELKMRQPHLMFTEKFSRIAEGRNGADWVWIIIGKNGNTFMLYVQAKRLFVSSQRYQSLIHAGPNPAEQIDKLIFNKFLYPLGYPVYPIYVFYNYIPTISPLIPCNCGQNIPVQLSGCSYADAFEVRKEIVLGRDHFADIGQHQYALSCLVCCDGKGRNRSEKLDLATTMFNRIVNREEFNEKYGESIDRRYDNQFNSESFLLKQPPYFVNQIMAGKDLEVNPFEKLEVSNITIMKEDDKL